MKLRIEFNSINIYNFNFLIDSFACSTEKIELRNSALLNPDYFHHYMQQTNAFQIKLLEPARYSCFWWETFDSLSIYIQTPHMEIHRKVFTSQKVQNFGNIQVERLFHCCNIVFIQLFANRNCLHSPLSVILVIRSDCRSKNCRNCASALFPEGDLSSKRRKE